MSHFCMPFHADDPSEDDTTVLGTDTWTLYQDSKLSLKIDVFKGELRY